MKKIYVVMLALFLALIGIVFYFKDAFISTRSESNNDVLIPTQGENEDSEKDSSQGIKNDVEQNTADKDTSLANPASVFCISNGGSLKIITESDGSQFGLCELDNYSCDEWVYYRGECDVEGDAQKIREKLIEKGLNLTNTEVVIKNHLGKFIGGSVVPINHDAGGGYVFAYKENGEIKIVADGNGIITCKQLEDFSDFPTYLIPECYDEVTSELVVR